MSIYPTKPFDCWKLAKEMRKDHYENVMTIKERGGVLICGGPGRGIASGFGDDVVCWMGESYGAEVCRRPELARECAAEVERRGYARDLCGYLRMEWGSHFLGRGPWGPLPKPDLVIRSQSCDTHANWGRGIADYYGIPMFMLDRPRRAPIRPKPHQVEYEVAQHLELIEWMEKQLGRPFNDEAFIEALVNSRTCSALWFECVTMNQAIPAPMDLKSMYSLMPIGVSETHTKRGVEFYKILRDELKDRVAQGIAAVGNERCRLHHENQPPWHALHIFRYMESFGAVCVTSHYQMASSGWEFDEEGRMVPQRPWEEPRPRTREEALRSELRHNTYAPEPTPSDDNLRIIDNLVKYWSIDGAVFHLNRGCEGIGKNRMEVRLHLQKKWGIPTVMYESSNTDRDDWNEGEVFKRLEAFFEGMGLSRIVA